MWQKKKNLEIVYKLCSDHQKKKLVIKIKIKTPVEYEYTWSIFRDLYTSSKIILTITLNR